MSVAGDALPVNAFREPCWEADLSAVFEWLTNGSPSLDGSLTKTAFGKKYCQLGISKSTLVAETVFRALNPKKNQLRVDDFYEALFENSEPMQDPGVRKFFDVLLAREFVYDDEVAKQWKMPRIIQTLNPDKKGTDWEDKLEALQVFVVKARKMSVPKFIEWFRKIKQYLCKALLSRRSQVSREAAITIGKIVLARPNDVQRWAPSLVEVLFQCARLGNKIEVISGTADDCIKCILKHVPDQPPKLPILAAVMGQAQTVKFDKSIGGTVTPEANVFSRRLCMKYLTLICDRQKGFTEKRWEEITELLSRDRFGINDADEVVRMTSYDLLARGSAAGLPGAGDFAESLSGISRRTYEDRLSVLVDSGVLPERMRPTRSQSAHLPSTNRKENREEPAAKKRHSRYKSEHHFFDILDTLDLDDELKTSPAFAPILPRSFPGVLPETRHRGNTYDLPEVFLHQPSPSPSPAPDRSRILSNRSGRGISNVSASPSVQDYRPRAPTEQTNLIRGIQAGSFGMPVPPARPKVRSAPLEPAAVVKTRARPRTTPVQIVSSGKSQSVVLPRPPILSGLAVRSTPNLKLEHDDASRKESTGSYREENYPGHLKPIRGSKHKKKRSFEDLASKMDSYRQKYGSNTSLRLLKPSSGGVKSMGSPLSAQEYPSLSNGSLLEMLSPKTAERQSRATQNTLSTGQVTPFSPKYRQNAFEVSDMSDVDITDIDPSAILSPTAVLEKGPSATLDATPTPANTKRGRDPTVFMPYLSGGAAEPAGRSRTESELGWMRGRMDLDEKWRPPSPPKPSARRESTPGNAKTPASPSRKRLSLRAIAERTSEISFQDLNEAGLAPAKGCCIIQ